MIASKVRSEWPGKVQKDGAGKTRVPVFWGDGRCNGRPGIVDEHHSIAQTRPDGEPEARLTYARVGRIKFHQEYIFAELMLGWWVSHNPTNHG